MIHLEPKYYKLQLSNESLVIDAPPTGIMLLYPAE